MSSKTLIANTGIQLLTIDIPIDLNSKFKEWFHEWYEPDKGEWNLELIHEKNTDMGRFYYRLDTMVKGGFLSSPEMEPDVDELRHFKVYPIKMDEEMANGEMGEVFDMTFSNRDNKFRSFLNQWIPVPYFFKRGSKRFTFGPLNWARMKLVPISEENGKLKCEAILAFDTRATYGENPDRKEHLCFPDLFARDIELGLCKNPIDVMDYCAPNEPWSFVNDRIFQIAHPGVPNVSKLHGQKRKMAYVASYIFLINFLAKNDLLPNIKVFKDTEVDTIDVDMVVDIGNSKTTALLVEDPHNANFRKVRHLSLTDFTNIVDMSDSEEVKIRQHNEPFDMRLAFRKEDFGNFGQKDSLQFVYPSLVRLGREATDLIRKATSNTGNGVTLSTFSSPKRYLWDKRPTQEEWRFLNLEGEKDDHVIFLPSLTSRLKSDGTVTKNDNGGGTNHYSPRSLMTFAFLEMLAQAIRQINSNDYRSFERGYGDVEKPRRIRKIVVTCPTAMSAEERRALVKCASQAVSLLSGFDGRGIIEKNIEVVPSIPSYDEDPVWYYDEATCSQLVYMYGEVAHKYKGKCEEFFSLYGKKDDGEDSPSLTIGSLDIGAGTSDLMICKYTYEKGDVTTISPDPLFFDSFYFAGDDMVNGMVKKLMLLGKESAFHHELKNLGESQYRQIIKDFFGLDHNFQTEADRILRKDFNIQYSVPLMYFYLDLLKKGVKEQMVTFNDVFGENAPNSNVIEGFKERTGIDVRKIVWKFNGDKVAEVVEQEFEPLLKKIATIMHAFACDVVLLSGRPSSLTPIRDIFLKYYAVPADRLIILNNYYVGDWYPFSRNTGYITDPKTIVAIGGMIGHYSSTVSNHKFQINLDKLNSGLKSTVNYIEGPHSEMESQYVITPAKSTGQLSVTLPVHLKVRQIDFESYEGRYLYTIDFNRHKIADRIIRRALTVEGVTYSDGKIEEMVKEEIEKLRARMRFTITLERDTENQELLRIVSITDKDDRDIIDSNIEINIQSLGVDDRYWLDTGEFNL